MTASLRIALIVTAGWAVGLLASCRTHTINTQFDLRGEAERKQELRFTGTRHIDSADLRSMTVDVWKMEHYNYPDSIRMFVRVLDTNGYVVTHMAPPYAKPGAPNYFQAVRERLKTRTRTRVVDIDPFTVREYGEQDSIPTSIALAIDNSGSMKPVKDAIDFGTQMFIGMKRPCDFVSVTSFHKEASVIVPLAADTGTMLREFREYAKKPVGLFSSVNDGIVTSLHTLENVPKDQPKVCVVFADGDENSSATKSAEIFDYATRHNISIYCVGFGYAQDEALEGLALYTGGKYYRAYTKKDLTAIFLDIYRSLQNYYLVKYVPPRFESLHLVDVVVNVPGRDTMVAHGQYDKSSLTASDVKKEFTRQILFAYKSSTIDTGSYYILDELATDMLRIELENVVLEVQGHTDNIGGEEYNAKLSLERAEAVKAALVARNVEEKRLRTRGFGFTVPVASNDTDEGRAQNRRTVFKVLRR